MQYLAIIPARGGSKGVPGKNIREIGGKPLIAWSIGQAKAVSAIARVAVSTDDPVIAAVAREYGAEVPFQRPEALARDTTPTEPVMLHAVDWYQKNGFIPDAVILLQPTSPWRRPGSLAAAIARFEQTMADSLLGVCENHHFFWKNEDQPEALYDFRNRPRRQDISREDRWYRENGSIYITRTRLLMDGGNRLGGKIAMYPMQEDESWEIDSLADFAIVAAFISHGDMP